MGDIFTLITKPDIYPDIRTFLMLQELVRGFNEELKRMTSRKI